MDPDSTACPYMGHQSTTREHNPGAGIWGSEKEIKAKVSEKDKEIIHRIYTANLVKLHALDQEHGVFSKYGYGWTREHITYNHYR